ncbi:MAG: TolC family protein, partial [Verrucomicrobiota bacterium]|nr:TolC family protein [Verrucomicrobiota bacterium]
MRKSLSFYLRGAAMLALFSSLGFVFAGSDNLEVRQGIPRFTLDQAILTALQRNPEIQRARQDIERTKGLYLEVRAEVLPRVDATSSFNDTDPHLSRVPGSGASGLGVERQYGLRVQATQVVFAGGRVVSQIRSADFQRDASYYAFRNVV